jgi:tetratricopeptide (TPR) repeat protein
MPEALARNAFARWSRAKNRLQPEVWPALRPTFKLSGSAKIFTIGSCFARNIEEHLQRLGCDVPMLRFGVPRDEFSGKRLNGILNRYTPVSILQIVEWTADIQRRGGIPTEQDCLRFAMQMPDGRWMDLDITTTAAVTCERLIERRQQIFETFQHAFSSDCVTITLGLIEAWRDTVLNAYCLQQPVGPAFKEDGRFVPELLSYEKSLSCVQSAIDIIRSFNPAVKILITTSPVPLGSTFLPMDVITATTYGKSVLRAVSGAVQMNNAETDYFPSYETVTLTKTWDIWEDDLLHPTDAIVGRIVASLVSAYFEAADEQRVLYQQVYTKVAGGNASPDVIRDAQKLATLDPDNALYRKTLGLAYLLTGQAGEAAAELRLSASLNETDEQTWATLCRACLQTDAPEDAVAAARRATQLRPDAAGYHSLLAQALLAAGAPEDAVAAVEIAAKLQRRATPPAMLILMGKIFAAVGRKEAAVDALANALKQAQPGTPLARRARRELAGVQRNVAA